MYKTVLHTACVLVTIAIAGCAHSPSLEVMQQADYGPSIDRSRFESIVRNESGFFDPYSAVIRCTEPEKAWAVYKFEEKYGYLASCKYNAKNRMGAYTGETVQAFMINRRRLLEIDQGSWRSLKDSQLFRGMK